MSTWKKSEPESDKGVKTRNDFEESFGLHIEHDFLTLGAVLTDH